MDTLTTPRAFPARCCELADANRLCPTFRKRDGVALIVSNVVGVGIFTTPCVVAALVPHAAGILPLWLVGGVLALAGARCYARLARRLPAAGGEYVYLSKAPPPVGLKARLRTRSFYALPTALFAAPCVSFGA